jgi:hypothetical protein
MCTRQGSGAVAALWAFECVQGGPFARQSHMLLMQPRPCKSLLLTCCSAGTCPLQQQRRRPGLQLLLASNLQQKAHCRRQRTGTGVVTAGCVAGAAGCGRRSPGRGHQAITPARGPKQHMGRSRCAWRHLQGHCSVREGEVWPWCRNAPSLHACKPMISYTTWSAFRSTDSCYKLNKAVKSPTWGCLPTQLPCIASRGC